MDKRYVEVMVDIETTGLKPGCGIWEIGAVAVRRDGVNEKEFEYTINPQSLLRAYPAFWDSATINWQETTNRANWHAAHSYDESVEAPHQMLIAFFIWCKDIKEASKLRGEEVRYWCKGTAFDFPIIVQMAEDLGMPDHLIPWKHNQLNDLRTICNVLDRPVPKFAGAHAALVDATHQMAHLLDVLIYLRDKEVI